MKAFGATVLVLAALLPAAAWAGAPPRPEIAGFRFDEDWRSLCGTADRPLLDQLKCLRLSTAATLTLGAELRERGEIVDKPDFGLTKDHDRVLLHRALVHGDLRLGNAVRAFVQLGYLDQTGRRIRPAPTDIDRLDLAQAFVDVSASLLGGRATVRGGRQEFTLGSSRLVSVRDAPNARRAYDGVRAFWVSGHRRVDVFYMQPVELRPGSFDDKTLGSEALWGASASVTLVGALKADVYALGYRRNQANFADGAGRERRDSVGLRLFGRSHGADWDFEGVYQTGKLGGQTIRAWTIASDSGYTLRGRLKPRIGLKADIASGDHDPSDTRIGTFNALYPKLPYFSEASLFAPANFIDLHPQVTIAPTRTLTLGAGMNWLWRETTADAVYRTPLVAIAGTAGQAGRFTGAQAIADVSWRPDPHLTVSSSYVHFTPGGVLRRVGGVQGDYLSVTTDWKF